MNVVMQLLWGIKSKKSGIVLRASNKANLHLQEVKQNRKYTQIQFMLFFQIKGIVCKTIAGGGVL